MVRSAANSEDDLSGRNKGGDQIAAAKPSLLRDGKRRWKDRGARVYADTGFGRPVEFEGMRQSAVGEGGHRRLHQVSARAQDPALPPLPVCRRVLDDHAAPRQTVY